MEGRSSVKCFTRMDTLLLLIKLLTWWLFLYLFVVIPWQYVQLSEPAYGKSFDLLYFSEELVEFLYRRKYVKGQG